MNLGEYLKDKLLYIITNLISIFLVLSLLITFNTNNYLIIIVVLILTISFLLPLINDYYKRKYFYIYLRKKLNELDQKYLIVELLEEPNFLDARILKEGLYEINKCYIENLSEYKYLMEEFKEYIELWCHEVKTPITTLKLMIENKSIDKKITPEINKLEYYVEQVLFYARSGNPEKDYLVSTINLKTVIDNVIKRNRTLLIENKVKIETIEDTFVSSDIKWLEFIVNQIVTNSIKYIKNNPYIKFSVQKNINNIILSIEDNGIGIPSSEIDRVFDKGFTGSNGRTLYNSTGIGLYLCKKLCDKLGHSISITSKENEFTKVMIVMPINSLTKEVK